MATQHPLRIFFGDLGVTEIYAGDTVGNDLPYADFTTGHRAGGDVAKRLHTRRPLGTTNGNVARWDEYLDLKSASIESSKAQDLTVFSDIGGVEDVQPWTESAGFINLPTNRYTIATNLLEFDLPTRRLSRPAPRIAPSPSPPILKLWNLQLNPASIAGYFQFWGTTWDAAGVNESSPSPISQIPYSNVNDDIKVIISNIENPAHLYSIYRSPLMFDPITGKLTIDDFGKALTGFHKVVTGAAPTLTFTADLCSAVYLSVFVPEDALNDARARIKFDYERHARQDSVSHAFKQEWLILNPVTKKYYKGLCVGLSPAFLDGFHYRTEDDGQLIVQVNEEGRWYNEAWTNPTAPYLVPDTRSTI